MSDEELRRLEKLAKNGDLAAKERLKKVRKRLGLCPEHGLDECDDCNPQTLVWDTYEIAENHAKYLREENPELTDKEAFEQACGDDIIYKQEWDAIIENLTIWLDELNDNVEWIDISGRSRRIFRANNTEMFLRELLPRSDYKFIIYKWKNRKYLRIEISDHDGRSSHDVYPITEYWISSSPECWKLSGRLLTQDDLDEASGILAKLISEKWKEVEVDITSDCIVTKGTPIPTDESRNDGVQELIDEINAFVRDKWKEVLIQVIGEISGYQECFCCGEVIMGADLCKNCYGAGCKGGDAACQYECRHDDYYVEDGIKICNDCGMGEDGQQY